MAAKEEWFYDFRSLYINISLRFIWVKFAIVAMDVRFLYIICNFEIFSTVNSSMASKMAAKLKKFYLLVIFAVLSK